MKRPDQTDTFAALQQLALLIPTLNAADDPLATLADLSELGRDLAEVIVVDGGSTDRTVALVNKSRARVLVTSAGRGWQLAHGLAGLSASWVMIMHADSRPLTGWREHVAAFIADPANVKRAGYFQLRLVSNRPEARRIERWADRRCRWFGLPYGDQGLVISRELLKEIGGINPLPLMEDVDLVRRITRARLVRLPVSMMTSPARYERDGWWLRPLRNLGCLLLYQLGLAPSLVARLYGRHPQG